MTFEVLPPEDWQTLAPAFAEQGGSLPDPDLARIVVARDDQAIAGFVVIQLQAHVEPLYVSPAYRHQGVALDLAAAAIALFPPGVPFYAFAPRDGIARLAVKAGLHELPWAVYRGVN